MKNRLLTLGVAMIALTAAANDDIFTPLLNEIEENSTYLKALRMHSDAEVVGNKTGLTLPNPEVELAYSWANPKEVGDKKNVSVSQSFDFPTVYAQRRKVASSKIKGVENEYMGARRDYLLNVKKTCIELLFNNALAKLYSNELSNLKKISDGMEIMLQNGETTSIEYNKALLNYSILENEVNKIDIERSKLSRQLAGYNGGRPVRFTVSDFPIVTLPSNFETWYSIAEDNSPALRALDNQLETNNHEVKLNRAEGLPKLSVGYTGEYVHGSNYSGVTLGFSLPLWENRNRVKQAKTELVATRLEIADAKLNLHNSLESLYNEVAELQENVQRIEKALNTANNAELAQKAHKNGQMTLLEYLHELEYYFDASEKHLEALRDLHLAYAELQAHEL